MLHNKEVIEKELGNIDDILESGNIKTITKWLKDNIHNNWSAYTGPEVFKKVYKKEITSEPIIKYFNDKYSK